MKQLTPQLVTSIEEIMENTETIDRYLEDPLLRPYALFLIKKGTYYFVTEKNKQLRFYPSRFIGYKNNSKSDHMQNRGKDVLDTNKRISEIIGRQPEKSSELEAELKKFCESLGVTAPKTGAFGVPSKYWRV